MMCCPRDGCPPVDGRWRRSCKGRTFGGAVPARVGWGGGRSYPYSQKRKGGGGGGKKWGGLGAEGPRVGEQEGRCWRWLC